MAINFVAIDIETAASTWDSICALSLVRVRDGAIVDRFYTLVNPECDFAPMNVHIHGITADMVSDAPTLPAIYDAIISFIGSDILVSHNMVFDGNSLFKGFEKYGLPIPPVTTFCTLACSRVLTLDLTNHKLPTLCKHYDITINHHHHADDDAQACAELMIAIANKLDADDLEEVSQLLSVFFGFLRNNCVFSPSTNISSAQGCRAGDPDTLLDDLRQAAPDIADEITMSYLKGNKQIAFKCADRLLFHYQASYYPFIKAGDIADGKRISAFATQYKDGKWKLPIDGAFLYRRFISIIADLCYGRHDQSTTFSFGCCNDFVICSDAGQCHKKDDPYYRGCLYRKNLEAGRVFYGKNKNI